MVNADTADINASIAGFVVSDVVKAKGSTIGVLFAGTIEGEPNVKVDARTAAAMGAAAAITYVILKRLFSRS